MALRVMHYTPRTIAFLTDLMHPPLTPDPRPIQRLHNAQFEASEPVYKSFNVTPEGAVLSNPVNAPGAHSSVTFTADRLRFREELTGLTVDEFVQRVSTVVEDVIDLIPIQLFTAQQVTIRTLVNPRNFKDSRQFLKAGMFGFDAETADFGREPHLYGIRMVFPPGQGEPNAHSLRIESFNSDPRSVYVENQGSFGPTVVQNGIAAVGENIAETYRFVVERALAFLSHFDARQEA